MLPKCTWDVFDLVLDYVYGFTVDMTESNVVYIFKIAQVLQMNALAAKCIGVMKDMTKEEMKPTKWDVAKAPSTVHIDQDGTCATRVAGSAWDASVIADGPGNTSYFAIKVVASPSNCNLRIGFVDNSLFKPNSPNFNSAGYFLNCCKGTRWSHKGGSARAYLNKSINAGEIVEARYDETAGNISFSVGAPGNLTDCGVAFTGVTATGFLRPCVDFYDVNNSVKLLCSCNKKGMSHMLQIAKLVQSASLIPGLESMYMSYIPDLAYFFNIIESDTLSSFSSEALHAILASPNRNGNSDKINQVICNHLCKANVNEEKESFQNFVDYISDINADAALTLLIPVVHYKDQLLLSKCIQSLSKSFWDSISKPISDEVINYKLLCALLGCDDLCVKNEDQVFDVIKGFTETCNLTSEEKKDIWMICRFAFVSAERHLIAHEIKEIDNLWLHLNTIAKSLQHSNKSLAHELKQNYGFILAPRTSYA